MTVSLSTSIVFLEKFHFLLAGRSGEISYFFAAQWFFATKHPKFGRKKAIPHILEGFFAVSTKISKWSFLEILEIETPKSIIFTKWNVVTARRFLQNGSFCTTFFKKIVFCENVDILIKMVGQISINQKIFLYVLPCCKAFRMLKSRKNDHLAACVKGIHQKYVFCWKKCVQAILL